MKLQQKLLLHAVESWAENINGEENLVSIWLVNELQVIRVLELKTVINRGRYFQYT